MTTQEVHFSIAGDFITQTARNLVIEGEWRKALRILDTLDGLSYELQVQILKCKKKLVGVNELELEDDCEEDNTHYIDQVKYMYGNLFEMNGKWYRPYGYITSMNIEDRQAAKEQNFYIGSRSFNNHYSDKEETALCRAHFYARNPASDKVYFYKEKGSVRKQIILLEEAQMPPLWINNTSIDEAIENAMPRLRGYGAEDGGNFIEGDLVEQQEVIVDSIDTDEVKHFDNLLKDLEQDVSDLNALEAKRLREVDQDQLAKEISLLESEILNNSEKPTDEQLYKLEDMYADRIGGGKDIYDLMYERDLRIRKASLAMYKKQIVKQAGDEWITLVTEPDDRKGYAGGEEIRVPKSPFINWCLSRSHGQHLAPEWECVCPPGMKMFGDDRYHTDWMVGAGLDLSEDYGHSSPVQSAAYSKMWEIQKEYLNFECAVLGGKGRVTGRVVLPGDKITDDRKILVVPNASPEYTVAALQVAERGGAVITETGGKLCHLATVGREKKLRIVRVENATELYQDGAEVTVDCDNGTVKIKDF